MYATTKAKLVAVASRRAGRPRKVEFTEFGERVERLIKPAGFASKAQFVDALPIRSMTLYRWQTGQSPPDAQTLSLMADLLGVTVDELLGRESPPVEPTTDKPDHPLLTEFLTTALGKTCDEDEIAKLRELRFDGGEPTAATYPAAIGLYRTFEKPNR